ncbi:MAG: hypothetical protein WCP77_08375 [Roseococcus sp.]
MNEKMRRFGIVAIALGGLGVAVFGVMLLQVMDDPKARTTGLAQGFLLAACIAGVGIFALSMALSARKPSRESE